MMNCKYCSSSNVVKFGTFQGIQRYWCKDCRRKFVLGTLPKMKTPFSNGVQMNGIYTAPEVAAILRVHINTIRRYIKQGKLKAFKYTDNSRWRITSKELEKFIQGRKENENPETTETKF